MHIFIQILWYGLKKWLNAPSLTGSSSFSYLDILSCPNKIQTGHFLISLFAVYIVFIQLYGWTIKNILYKNCIFIENVSVLSYYVYLIVTTLPAIYKFCRIFGISNIVNTNGIPLICVVIYIWFKINGVNALIYYICFKIIVKNIKR